MGHRYKQAALVYDASGWLGVLMLLRDGGERRIQGMTRPLHDDELFVVVVCVALESCKGMCGAELYAATVCSSGGVADVSRDAAELEGRCCVWWDRTQSGVDRFAKRSTRARRWRAWLGRSLTERSGARGADDAHDSMRARGGAEALKVGAWVALALVGARLLSRRRRRWACSGVRIRLGGGAGVKRSPSPKRRAPRGGAAMNDSDQRLSKVERRLLDELLAFRAALPAHPPLEVGRPAPARPAQSGIRSRNSASSGLPRCGEYRAHLAMDWSCSP